MYAQLHTYTHTQIALILTPKHNPQVARSPTTPLKQHVYLLQWNAICIANQFIINIYKK